MSAVSHIATHVHTFTRPRDPGTSVATTHPPESVRAYRPCMHAEHPRVHPWPPTSDATVEGPTHRTPWTQPTNSREREPLRVGVPRYDSKTDNTGTHIGRQTVGGDLWILGSLDFTQGGWVWGGGQGERSTLHLLLIMHRLCMATILCRQFGWVQGCGDSFHTTCFSSQRVCKRTYPFERMLAGYTLPSNQTRMQMDVATGPLKNAKHCFAAILESIWCGPWLFALIAPRFSESIWCGPSL